MGVSTRYFTVTTPQGLSTIKLDSKGCATAQITVKNVSRTTIDGRAVLVSLPVTRPASGPVERGWVKIDGPLDRHFEVDQEEVFSIKIAVPPPKKGEPASEGNYSFRLDLINVARPDDSGDQSQALGFTVAKATPPPPTKWPLIALVAGLVLLVGGVTAWLLMRKPSPTPVPTPTPTASATPAPVQGPTILGVGMGKELFTRAGLNSPWVPVPNSCCVQAVTQLPDGTILAAGTDTNLWTRATVNSNWVKVPTAPCCVTGVAVMPGGTILAIGLDKTLFTKATLNSAWVQVPNSCCAVSLSVMPDGTILITSTDNYLWTRAGLNGGYTQLANSCCMIGVTEMPDGTILGVGTNNALWTRATLNSRWVFVQNSGSVVAVTPLR